MRIRKLPLRLLVATVTFALGVLVTMLWVIPRFSVKQQTLQLEIPNSPWEPAFFAQLEERTTAVDLPSLRTIVLPEDDLEVRVWYEFEIITGYVIRRTGPHWSAHWVFQTKDHLPSSAKMVTLNPPKSGWESLWKKLVNAGILTLPDSPRPQCQNEALDGISYIVETNVNRKYRTYIYSNPKLMKCSEAKQMLEIDKIIGDEFSAPFFER